jgi:hypothetical protein
MCPQRSILNYSHFVHTVQTRRLPSASEILERFDKPHDCTVIETRRFTTIAMNLTVALSIASFVRISVRPPRRKDDTVKS